jgi:NADH-quinone oxidoreductase subunit G
VLVGERASTQTGLLTAVSQLLAATGSVVGWVPRRAGERGALDAGALPILLPGGRPVADAVARVDAATIWGVDAVPDAEGLDIPAMLAASRTGDIAALVMAGAELADIGPEAAASLQSADFVVSLDTRSHEVTEHADVVLPVAAAPEKHGTFVDWEGRARRFDQAVRDTGLMTDARVLSALSDELGRPLELRDAGACRRQLAEFADWAGVRLAPPDLAAPEVTPAASPLLTLVNWRPLLDHGALQQGEPYLAATARSVEVLVSSDTAQALGVSDGAQVSVGGASGAVTGTLSVVHAAPGTATVVGDVSRQLGSVTGDPVSVTAVTLTARESA